MPEIIGQPNWSPVRLLQKDEYATGGQDGNMNEQAQSLANRTEYLNQEKAGKDEIINGQFRFATLAAFDAKKATIPFNSTVIIDEAGASQGANTWDGIQLKKSPYDPLKKANDYTDTFATNFPSSAFTAQGFISDTGTFFSSPAFKCTGFIKVVSGFDYRIYSYITGTARHAWYDQNQNFISAFGTDQTSLSEKVYTAPANAAFIRVSAYGSAVWNVAYIKSNVYSIDVIRAILQQHTPNIDSSKIDYSGTSLKATLDSVLIKQVQLIESNNLLFNKLDLLDDKDSVFFFNTSQYVKSTKYPTNFGIVNITSRISNTKMEVSDVTAFVQDSACVVYDPTANTYTSHAVLNITDKVITVTPDLPNNPTQVQTMHEKLEGQHLSLFGYRGLADAIASSGQKYCYKKAENLVFNFNPTKYKKETSSGGQITTDGSHVEIPVLRLGTAKTGGVLPGTNLPKVCDLVEKLGIGGQPTTQYLSSSYKLTDSIAGNGYEISFSAKNSDGFIEIPLAVRNELYKSDSDNLNYRTAGNIRLQVFNGANLIHDAIYTPGLVHHVFVDFFSADTIKIRVTCADSVPTSSLLSGIFAYKKSPQTSKDLIFHSGAKCAFLADSWSQYMLAVNNEGAFRPDGSRSNGNQELSVRLKARLEHMGITTTMLNMGFGGQTSRWGKYWVHKIPDLTPKPTHCIINFGINDINSMSVPTNDFYDFDPVNMFLNKPESQGGINGRTASVEEYIQNLIDICNSLTSQSIKVILMMPCQTASDAQAQQIRDLLLNRLAAGFTS
ncbi:hypothetical protein QDR98_01150 [Acinetobacter baumannii]|uniref:hypothetical protein n=1 Tax=Acinetobacter baumannii TaxID=470 RepID=UPI002446B5FC|nr:hypothetical protein [Acinetobacter baumannii]MDH2664586.1 hypothetical protein [Acinetobacter baumannii]